MLFSGVTVLYEQQPSRLKHLLKFKLRISKLKVVDKFHITIEQAKRRSDFLEALELLSLFELKEMIQVKNFEFFKRSIEKPETWTPIKKFQLI